MSLISTTTQKASILSSLNHAPYPDKTNVTVLGGPGTVQGIKTISSEKSTDAFGQTVIHQVAEGQTAGTAKARVEVFATVTDPANNTGTGHFTVSIVGGPQVFDSGPVEFGQAYP